MSETLLDTTPLRDQRTMVVLTGLRDRHETPEQVREAWELFVRGYEIPGAAPFNRVPGAGLIARRRVGDYSTDLRHSDEALTVYVSGGRWIANCPTCNGGVAAWPYHERGCCLDCGTTYPLDYPDEGEIRRAAELLAPRVEAHRNWHRHVGEGVERLEAENALHPQMLAGSRTRVTLDLARLDDETRALLAEKGLIR